MELDQEARLTGDALVFLKHWRDSIRHREAFEKLSGKCADILKIKDDLEKRDFHQLIDMDYFRLIDRKIISDLVKSVANRTITDGDCAAIIRARRQGHWYQDFMHLYNSIDFAAQFMKMSSEVNLSIESLSDGISKYTTSLFRIDQLYRKYIYHARKSGQISLLENLTEKVENLYSNKFLLSVNDTWQRHIDISKDMNISSINLQRNFFRDYVKPYLAANKKIIVVISDAMRFEIGDELLGLIRQEDRYEAEIEPIQSMIPSYTQLGMAALLPNKELSFTGDDTASVLVDGISSKGTANRGKILNNALPGQATSIRSEILLGLNKEDCRTLIRDHDVVYVYHNRIDAMGDKKDSEDRVFEAAEETLTELVKIIKKLTGANANNIIITSDHGFIYQNKPIDESDFAAAEPKGRQILFRDRRFVLGKGLESHPSLRLFNSEDLGLTGDIEIQIPKSINRLRLKGSGSRYVHGGTSLQEIVIPVLKINKKRKSDVSSVNIDIIRGSATTISTSQFSVALYQTQPVTEKIQARTLRVGIYSENNELISDSHELTFDFTSENPREREHKIRLILTKKADDANQQEVILRLDELIPDTSYYREYKSVRYFMRRSFTSDFDF